MANEILMQIRSDKRQQNEVYLDEPIGCDSEGNAISLFDILDNQDDSVDDHVEKKSQILGLYDKMHKVLKKREFNILKLRYGLSNCEAKTQREIAKQMGISRSYVSRIEKKAISKLYKSIEQ